MLSRRHKISRKIFPSHKDQKSSWAGKVLRIEAYKISDKESAPRFAVVISKRMSDGAVMRNLFKRQVMGVIEEEMELFCKLPQKKYVIFPKVHLRTTAYEEIHRDIEIFLAQHK